MGRPAPTPLQVQLKQNQALLKLSQLLHRLNQLQLKLTHPKVLLLIQQIKTTIQMQFIYNNKLNVVEHQSKQKHQVN